MEGLTEKQVSGWKERNLAAITIFKNLFCNL